MDAEDLLTPLDVGLVDQNLPIEPPGPEQRRVEDFRPVGRAHDDHALARVEAVHLGEELIERLLAFFMAADRALHADLPERVELVDEHDARRLGFRLLEQIADPGGADANEHLHEFGTAQAEERHVRFAGDGAGEQRLAGARRADEQHAFRNPAAQVRVLLRVLQELDDLLELLLGFVDAGHIREAHFHFIVRVNLRFAARERHHPAFRAAHAPEEEAPDGDQEDDRDDPAEQLRQPRVDDLAGVLHALRFELLDELRIFDGRRREVPRAFGIGRQRGLERAPDHLLADHDLRD